MGKMLGKCWEDMGTYWEIPETWRFIAAKTVHWGFFRPAMFVYGKVV
jgi:hypothetical protein